MPRSLTVRLLSLTATAFLVIAAPVLADVSVGIVQGVNPANRQMFVQVAGKGVVTFTVTPRTNVKTAAGKTIPVKALAQTPAGTIVKITHNKQGLASDIMLKKGAAGPPAPAARKKK